MEMQRQNRWSVARTLLAALLACVLAGRVDGRPRRKERTGMAEAKVREALLRALPDGWSVVSVTAMRLGAIFGDGAQRFDVHLRSQDGGRTSPVHAWVMPRIPGEAAPSSGPDAMLCESDRWRAYVRAALDARIRAALVPIVEAAFAGLSELFPRPPDTPAVMAPPIAAGPARLGPGDLVPTALPGGELPPLPPMPPMGPHPGIAPGPRDTQGCMTSCVYCRDVRPDLKDCPYCKGAKRYFQPAQMMDRPSRWRRMVDELREVVAHEDEFLNAPPDKKAAKALRDHFLRVLQHIQIYDFDPRRNVADFIRQLETDFDLEPGP